MNDFSFSLLGLDTLEHLELGNGLRYMEHWSPEQYSGPWVLTIALGGPSNCSRYLYPDHLHLLYERFRQANPNGVRKGITDVLDEDHRLALGMTLQQHNEWAERNDAFSGLTGNDEHLGHPRLRRYLPEVYLPETLRRMEADPWLDDMLLEMAIRRRHVPDSRERHPRWSPEWRAYCDRLSGRFPEGWKNAPGSRKPW